IGNLQRRLWNLFYFNQTASAIPGVIHTDWRVLRRLLSYTYSRVRETSLMPVWREAFKRLADEFPTGAELVGVLVRDTTPQAKDVAHHAGALSGKLPNVDCVSLLALYICVPAKNWSLHCTPL
ncbi:hypothetical protein, partial [Burkholderia multivorans]|uniref:hypothetical protein n=1 Tax=Burkholderia multivorans TaxID=87883 RepID=UPI0028706176